VRARILGAAAAVRHRWRASLQTRVVATTLVLSATVSLLLGAVVLHQVRSGLLGAVTRSAQSELNGGVARAEQQFLALPDDNASAVERTAYGVVTELSANQGDYEVVMLPSGGALASYGLQSVVASIPVALRRTVASGQREAWAYTRLYPGSGPSRAALAIGAPVEAGGLRYQLFYVFPLARDAATLRLVERTMLFAGAALVLLLVGIAAVVTREVVRPVRQAAATAERLAAGRLKERMTIRGEDDLATLAASFNRMADTVQQQISQLREMSRLQRRFVADVSHELRTPITTIRMAADVLHDSSAELPPELTRSSELLQAQLDRFESLLSDLLEISRHDAGAAVLEAEPTNLVPLIERVVSLATPLAERRGSPVVADLPSAPVVAEIDPRRIDRVLRNLVDNALDHGEGRPVEVRLRGGEGGIAITVRDHGVGLRPGEAALVFGRFWRADPARARTRGGTGLGLSIALEDVRLHGGWLQAWGEPGRGSSFRLTLPWRVGQPLVESPLPLEPAGADGPAQPART
jgi:two-component system sensor histidine kinase MtrB